MTLHLELRDAVEARYGDALEGPVDLRQDAMILRLGNGVTMEVRFAAEDAYSIRWIAEDREFCIDTAPRKDVPGASHYHNHKGQVLPDPLTRPGADPADNLARVIDAVLVSPMLEEGVR